MKHRWWHFIKGREERRELITKSEHSETYNVLEVCRVCGEQIGEKVGFTHFALPPFCIKKEKDTL